MQKKTLPPTSVVFVYRFSHDSPPGTGGISEGSFSMKNQGSEGIGGIWGFSADGDAPPRYGGDFWGFGGGLFWSSEGIGGRNPSDSRGGTCEH